MAYYMGKSFWLNGLKMTLAFVPLDTVKAILAVSLDYLAPQEALQSDFRSCVTYRQVR